MRMRPDYALDQADGDAKSGSDLPLRDLTGSERGHALKPGQLPVSMAPWEALGPWRGHLYLRLESPHLAVARSAVRMV